MLYTDKREEWCWVFADIVKLAKLKKTFRENATLGVVH